MTEYNFTFKNDYDDSFDVGKKSVKCYSDKMMRELYPDGSYNIVGETLPNNKKEKSASLSVAGLSMRVSDAGSHSSLLYSGKKFICVGGDNYVVLLKSRAAFFIFLFMGIAFALLLAALIIKLSGGSGGNTVLPPDYEKLPDDPHAEYVGEKAFTVGGTVVSGGRTVSGAEVRLCSGSDVLQTVRSGEDGSFSFDKVKAGIYTVIIITPDGEMSFLVRVDGGNVSDEFNIPEGSVSVKINVTGSKNVSVGGLDSEVLRYAENGKKVTLTMSVDEVEDLTGKASVPDTDPAKADQLKIKEKSGDLTLTFLDLGLMLKTEANGSETVRDIHETENVLEIVVPMKTTTLIGLSVFRVHDGELTEFKKLSSVPDDPEDGTFLVSGNGVTIYADRFSAYAIGYIDTGKTTGGSVAIGFDNKAAAHLLSGRVDMYYYHDFAATHNAVVQIIAVRGDDEYLVAQSGTLAPGYSLSEISINGNVGLSEGVYNGKMRLLFFNGEDETTNMNTDIPITITVTND